MTTGYQTKIETYRIGNHTYQIQSLLDRNQYSDPNGEAERVGISSANWPIFGQVWPSALVLASLMNDFAILPCEKRILEIGAGLALASLVLQRRASDVTVSDHHPLSPIFLQENARLNDLPPLNYQIGDWEKQNPELGAFDVIIASDVLYENHHATLVASFIDQHASPIAEAIVVDPDRGHHNRFIRAMAHFGFVCTSRRADPVLEGGERFRGRIMHFRRM